MITDDRWFDWTYLIEDLRDRLNHDAEKYDTEGMTSDSKGVAAEIRHAAALLDYILDADTNGVDDCNGKHRQESIDRAFDFIKAHLLNWWD
jgi:hypothetical protein